MSLWEQRAVQPYVDALELGQLEYEAALPKSLGIMPVEERGLLTGWTSPDIDNPDISINYGRPNGYPLQDIVRLLPGTFRLMLDDAREVTDGAAAIDEVKVQSKHTPAGEAPREREWHIDFMGQDPEDAARPLYMVSSHEPTVFYEGPVRLERPTSSMLDVDQTSIPNDAKLWTPKNFEIVRIGAATVHASPVFKQAARRTFMQVGTRLLRDI